MSTYNELEIQESKRHRNKESELFDKMKYLYPNLTLDEIYEELNREGFDNLNHRINQNLKSREELIQKYGGDGKGLLRKFRSMDQDGQLDRIITKQKKKLEKWKQLLK